MVACSRCQKKGLGCRMASLSKRCGNCIQSGCMVCIPGDVPVIDFSKIDREMKKLEDEELDAEASLNHEVEQAELAAQRARQAQAKLARLRKQKRLLKRKEQAMFDKGLEHVEELEQLEMLEELGQDIASVNPSAPLGAEIIDWSRFWNIPGDSVGETAAADVGSS